MKKNLTLISLMLGIMLLISVSAIVSAGDFCGPGCGTVSITSVKLDGQNQVTVAPDASITASVTVFGSGDHEGNDWESTKYIIQGQGEVCVNTANHDYDGTNTESFGITAPSSPGSYDFTVRVYHNEGCNDYADAETLWNGIIVVQQGGCDGNCDINIVDPNSEDYFYCPSEDGLSIDWTATGTDCTSYDIYYGLWDGDSCSLQGHLGTTYLQDTSFLWDALGLDNGDYCVKVTGACCNDDEENFCIDCTKPIVDPLCVNTNCPSCNEGIESDTYTDETQTVIEPPVYSDPDNNCDEQCKLTCEIDWGDYSPVQSCDEACDEWGCYHQYADNGVYTVNVSVTDCADNTGTSKKEVTVENADPICEGISISPDDYVVGLPLTFTGIATDVDADIPLTYNWNFDDGTSLSDGYEVMHTYTVAGDYAVTLTVQDKDGGSATCVLDPEVLPVVEPTVLDDQEMSLCECLDANFGEDSGQVSNSFETGLEGDARCSLVGDDYPNGLSVQGNGNDCVVTWCHAKDDDIGTHPVVVKATDGDETEYYSFDIDVYQYGIHFDAGWNLFSIPLVPENDDTSIDTVLSGIIDNVAYEGASTAEVLQYDAMDDKWYKARPYSDAHGFTWAGSELMNIIPGYGYWIHMNAPDTLYLNGEKMYNADSSAYPPSVTLGMDSWNLIGVYGIGDCCKSSIKISDALVSLTDPEDNPYYDIIYDEDGHSPFYKLQSKEGYWLSLKKVLADDETIQYKANYNTHNFPDFWSVD